MTKLFNVRRSENQMSYQLIGLKRLDIRFGQEIGACDNIRIHKTYYCQFALESHLLSLSLLPLSNNVFLCQLGNTTVFRFPANKAKLRLK